MFAYRLRWQVWIGVTLTAWLSVGCANKVPSDEDPSLPNTARTGAGASGASHLGATGGAPGAAGMLPGGASGSSSVAGMSGNASAGKGGSSGMSGNAGKGSGGSSGMSGNAGMGGSSGMSGNAGSGGSSGMSGDAGVDPGPVDGRDPNGPCKDLELFCFDPFDMFIFNPECFTCNNGDGCQACVLFQAE